MRMVYGISLLILGVVALMATVACGPSSSSASAESGGTDMASLDSATEAMGFVPSSKAGAHMGQEVTVRGFVQDYSYSAGAKGKPYRLLFDEGVTLERGSGVSDMASPETFMAIIWKEDRKNFPSNFAADYSGNVICVTGLVEEIEGNPAIVARDPSQLEVGC